MAVILNFKNQSSNDQRSTGASRPLGTSRTRPAQAAGRCGYVFLSQKAGLECLNELRRVAALDVVDLTAARVAGASLVAAVGEMLADPAIATVVVVGSERGPAELELAYYLPRLRADKPVFVHLPDEVVWPAWEDKGAKKSDALSQAGARVVGAKSLPHLVMDGIYGAKTHKERMTGTEFTSALAQVEAECYPVAKSA